MMSLKRIIQLLLVSLFVFELHAAGPEKKPNIVFVLADDLGYATSVRSVRKSSARRPSTNSPGKA
jgi:hypothetical protein